jgi:hypothetical protein
MCGNYFNSSEYPANNTFCNVPCTGNSSQMCGGIVGSTFYISVYATNFGKK